LRPEQINGITRALESPGAGGPTPEEGP
jgi:hypothetical protein